MPPSPTSSPHRSCPVQYLRLALVWPGGWDAPVRAHLLLEHAAFLSATAAGDQHSWSAAVDYAAALAPDVAAAVGAGLAGLSSTSDPSSWSPAHRLAALSGGAASATSLARELLLRRPCEVERDALAAVAQAERLGFLDTAASLRTTWGKRLLSQGCVVNASRWLLDSDCVSGLRTLSQALFHLQQRSVAAGLRVWRAAGRPVVPCCPGPCARPALSAPAWLEELVAGQDAVGAVCDAWSLSSSGSESPSSTSADPAVAAVTSALEWLADRSSTEPDSPIARVPLLPFVLRFWRLCLSLLLMHRHQQQQQARLRSTASQRVGVQPVAASASSVADPPASDWAVLLSSLLPRSAGRIAGVPVDLQSTDGVPFPFIGALLLLGHAGGLLVSEVHQPAAPDARDELHRALKARTSGPVPPALTAGQARVVLHAVQHMQVGDLRAPSAGQARAGGDAVASGPVDGLQPWPEELSAVHADAVRCTAVALITARML
jgi:hypothetical protein